MRNPVICVLMVLFLSTGPAMAGDDPPGEGVGASVSTAAHAVGASAATPPDPMAPKALDEETALRRLLPGGCAPGVEGTIGPGCILRETLVCDVGDVMRITGSSGLIPAGVVIVASGDCSLEIDGMTLTGTVALEIRDHASVTVRDSILAGTAVAIRARGRVTLRVEDSLLIGPVALEAWGDARVVAVRSFLQAKDYSVETRGEARVEVDGCKAIAPADSRHGGHVTGVSLAPK